MVIYIWECLSDCQLDMGANVLIKPHTMKMYREMDTQFHIFLIAAVVDGGE
jgi:hypothetical protein